MLARREAQILLKGEQSNTNVTRNINQRLLTSFGHRTLEAIKELRRLNEYKTEVESFLTQIRNQHQERIPLPKQEDPQLAESIEDHIRELHPVETKTFNADKLQNVCNINNITTDNLLYDITTYLKETFPTAHRTNFRKTPRTTSTLNQRLKRRAQYAKVQDLWKKDRG